MRNLLYSMTHYVQNICPLVPIKMLFHHYEESTVFMTHYVQKCPLVPIKMLFHHHEEFTVFNATRDQWQTYLASTLRGHRNGREPGIAHNSSAQQSCVSLRAQASLVMEIRRLIACQCTTSLHTWYMLPSCSCKTMKLFFFFFFFFFFCFFF
jgi:hypothetical protein